MSERLRIVGLGGLLLALMTWWTVVTWRGDHGTNAFRFHPDRHQGEAIVLSLVIAGEPHPEGYDVWKGDVRFVVDADEAPAVGSVVTVGGTFRDGVVVEEWVEPHPQRRGKWQLALGGLVLWSLTLPLWLLWDGRGRVRG